MDKLKHLSIKTTIVLAIIAAIVVASCCSTITIMLVDQQMNAITEKYIESGKLYYLSDKNGERVGEGTIIYQTSPAYSQGDKEKLRMLEVARTISIPVYFVISLLVAVFLFYRKKIQRPLQLLDEAAANIAQQNLDFTLHYPIKDEMGNLISSFEQMRQALAKNHQMMWRTAEERKRVNAAFAHDLRTPLTVLKGYNSFLQMNIHNPKMTEEKFRSTSQLMEQQINRLEGFVESMSSIQKLEDITLEARQVQSVTLIQNVEEIIQALQPKQKVRLQSTLQPNLEGIDLEIVLQVFENLFANALRYAITKVTIQLVEDQAFLKLMIEDDGPGFSSAALNEATNPFYKEDTESQSHFGLGLYISKVLCEKHGGSLQLTNNEKGASTIASFKYL